MEPAGPVGCFGALWAWALPEPFAPLGERELRDPLLSGDVPKGSEAAEVWTRFSGGLLSSGASWGPQS